jgi:hypothetical protein
MVSVVVRVRKAHYKRQVGITEQLMVSTQTAVMKELLMQNIFRKNTIVAVVTALFIIGVVLAAPVSANTLFDDSTQQWLNEKPGDKPVAQETAQDKAMSDAENGNLYFIP